MKTAHHPPYHWRKKLEQDRERNFRAAKTCNWLTLLHAAETVARVRRRQSSQATMR